MIHLRSCGLKTRGRASLRSPMLRLGARGTPRSHVRSSPRRAPVGDGCGARSGRCPRCSSGRGWRAAPRGSARGRPRPPSRTVRLRAFRPARSISSSAPVTSRRMSHPTWGWMEISASISAVSARSLGAGAGPARRDQETARRAPASGVALLDHAFPSSDPDQDEAEAASERQAGHESGLSASIVLFVSPLGSLETCLHSGPRPLPCYGGLARPTAVLSILSVTVRSL